MIDPVLGSVSGEREVLDIVTVGVVVESVRGVEERRIVLSRRPRDCAHDCCASMPRDSPPIG